MTTPLFRSLPLLALGIAGLPACGEDDAAARGAAILEPLKVQLKQALVAGLEQGPASAISVCSEQAPAIAAALSVDGVVVGRTSHRLRNPNNRAPGWVTPVLEGYLDAGSDRAPAVVRLEGGRTGYVEPILMQPLCLTCHGDTLAPEVAERIEEEYPQDEATGFAPGELRGVFWAEFPAGR